MPPERKDGIAKRVEWHGGQSVRRIETRELSPPGSVFKVAIGDTRAEWNDIYGNGTYDFYNGNPEVYAYYAYWDTTDPSVIASHIWDDVDDRSFECRVLHALAGSESFERTDTGAFRDHAHH